MDNLDKVEKLRAKTGLSYDEARTVLEECDWDILDAIIKLEAEGKIKNDTSSSYTTEGGGQSEIPRNPQQVAESYHNYSNKRNNEKGFFRTLWDGFVLLLKKGCENTFIVSKEDRRIMEIPVLLLVILMICSICLVLVVMIIGLFCGYRYSFSGPDLGRKSVNDAMNRAGEAAESFKDDIQHGEAYPKSASDIDNDDDFKKKEISYVRKNTYYRG